MTDDLDTFVREIWTAENRIRMRDDLLREALKPYDLTPDQALILHRLRDLTMPIGDCYLVGVYMGTNISYNVKKLVKGGYLNYVKDLNDSRRSLISVTDKSKPITEIVMRAYSNLFKTRMVRL